MELNYEKRYAYAEVDCILNWLGEEYRNKIPKRILRKIKDEKKYGYKPQLDFNKPLETQVRQETKNIIAYLNCTYWLKDKEEKKKIEEAISQNAKIEKENRRIERMKEIAKRAESQENITLTASIDKALRENTNN